jgi:hypothetical protein
MSYTYSDIQSEIKRRGIRDQSGTEFDTAAKNLANAALFSLSREAFWRQLRRTTTFQTEAEQTSGTVDATNNSASMTGTGLSLITNGIQVGRRIEVGGSSRDYVIKTITGENAFTVDKLYDGTTDTGLTYKIFGREEYNLPLQTGRVAFMWHEQFGFPFVLRYIPARNFFETSVPLDTGQIPTHYKMWGENNTIQQPLEASVLTVSSSASGDTSKTITIFGTVAGFPDSETISTNSSDGTTTASGSKAFTEVERITKAESTTGRITITSNTANVTVATLPTGDTTGSVMYRKIQLYPLPQDVFPVNVWYYKDPWRLVGDSDIHELGADFDEAIILLAVAKLKYENAQKEGDKWFALYKDELRNLKKKNTDKLDYTPSLMEPSRGVLSNRVHPHLDFAQLGGMFGPMSVR